MPAPFFRTMRSIQGDGFGPSVALLAAGALLLGALVAWLLAAEVAVYERTDLLRLEVAQAVAPVAARAGGRVVVSRLALGREVEKDEVLVQLDSEREELLLREGRARLQQIRAQMEPLLGEIALRERAPAQTQQTGRAEADEARARYREATTLARIADGETARAKQLLAQGLLAPAEAEQKSANAEAKRAEAEALRIAIDRTEAEYRRRVGDLEAEVGRLRRERVSLEAQQVVEQEVIGRLEHEIELRRIRAPVGGIIGEAVSLQAGAVLKEGERVGAVVPPGNLKAVAEFAPAAIGRLKVGQPARLRLEGFPSIQYGTTPAVVDSVGAEPREGRVRVELRVVSESPAIPFQHGLPGSVEVEVERVHPITLVLRATGAYLLEDRPVDR